MKISTLHTSTPKVAVFQNACVVTSEAKSLTFLTTPPEIQWHFSTLLPFEMLEERSNSTSRSIAFLRHVTIESRTVRDQLFLSF